MRQIPMKVTGRLMALSRRRVLRSGVAMVAAITCKRSLPAQSTLDQSWILENDLIRREVAFLPGAGLYTRQISDKRTGAELLLPRRDVAKAHPEFSFNCDGKPCTSNSGDFDLLNASPASSGNENSLSVSLHHKQIALEATALYSVYKQH